MPQKTGIGVDIESIERFADLKDNKKTYFLNKVYTKNELEYCLAQKNFAQHLAGRYTAKEAIIKAFGSINKKIFYNEIEIIRNKNGSLKVKICNKNLEKYEVLISLAHSRDNAIAFAIINAK